MNIFFIRHAQAEHLQEDWKKVKITRNDFIEKMHTWEGVELTEEGINQAYNLANSMKFNYKCIFSSPLPRSTKTAEIINIKQKKAATLDLLKEIITYPPAFLGRLRFSIMTWIYICIICSIFNGEAWRVFRSAKQIFKELLEQQDDIIVVSHSMRIRSLILYARFCHDLRVIKTDYTTCGVSIVCKKEVESKVPSEEVLAT